MATGPKHRLHDSHHLIWFDATEKDKLHATQSGPFRTRRDQVIFIGFLAQISSALYIPGPILSKFMGLFS